MEKPVAKATVHIAGEEYTLRGGESVSEMQELASYLNGKVEEIVNRNPRLPKSKVMVLAALNVVDELFKLKKEYNELINLIEDEIK